MPPVAVRAAFSHELSRPKYDRQQQVFLPEQIPNLVGQCIVLLLKKKAFNQCLTFTRFTGKKGGGGLKAAPTKLSFGGHFLHLFPPKCNIAENPLAAAHCVVRARAYCNQLPLFWPFISTLLNTILRACYCAPFFSILYSGASNLLHF